MGNNSNVVGDIGGQSMGLMTGLLKKKTIIVIVIAGIVALALYQYDTDRARPEIENDITLSIEIMGSDGSEHAGSIEVDEDISLLSVLGGKQSVKLLPLTVYTAEASDLDMTGEVYYYIKPSISVKIRPTEKVPSGEYTGHICWTANGTSGDGRALTASAVDIITQFDGTVYNPTVGESTIIGPNSYHYPRAKLSPDGRNEAIRGTDIGGTTMYFNVSAKLNNPDGGRPFLGSTNFSFTIINTGDSLELEITNIGVEVI